MMPEQAPPCVCGVRNYESRGGYVGGFAQSNFVCLDCQRILMVLDGWGVGSHAIFPTEGTEINKAASDYINGPLFATFRGHEEACRALEERLYEERALNHKAVCVRLGIDVKTSYYDLPKEVREDIDPKREQLRRDVWTMIEPPLPPKLPPSIRIFRLGGGKWTEVDHAASALLEIPTDPIRLHHDAFWKRIFETLATRGYALSPKHAPNGYYNDVNNLEPWFAFEHKDVEYLVGPRKRVISITAKSKLHLLSDPRPFSVERLAALATADSTTYAPEGGIFVKATTEVTVHAYGKEKTIEYLTTLFEETA